MVSGTQHEVVRQALYVAGLLVVEVVASSISWRLAGAKRGGGRVVGRVMAAFFALANVGLVLGCLFHLLRGGVDWFYSALLVLGFVFTYRIGGATVGRYP